MIGLTGLVDTQLATKLSQRLDLLALKAEVQIDGPGPAIQVEKVVNNVGLFSRAALDRQIPAGASAVPHPAVAQLPAVELSVAARVISAVLTDIQAAAEPVRGATPLWPSLQAPSAAALAGTLAQTVSSSGLFYESHLLQFATGSRTLAQLTQEPQARWALPMAATSDALPSPAEPLLRGALQQALAIIAGQNPLASSGQSPPDQVRPSGDLPDAQGLPADAEESAVTLSARAAVPSTNGNAHADVARLQAAYRWVEAVSTGRALETAPVQRAGDSAHPAGGVAAPGVVSAPPVAEVIHPQAVALLRQQLDLLASAVFRWSGAASPGVAMEWSIQEEQADHHAGTPDEDRPKRWATTLSLTLPRLGAVDIRLGLTGPIVQAHLAASDPATLARLQADGGDLAQRLETAGLSLQALQVTAMTRP
jgi:hypothetical protein